MQELWQKNSWLESINYCRVLKRVCICGVAEPCFFEIFRRLRENDERRISILVKKLIQLSHFALLLKSSQSQASFIMGCGSSSAADASMDISCRGGEELDLDASSRGERHEKHVVHKDLPVFIAHPEEYQHHDNNHHTVTAPSSVDSTSSASITRIPSATPKIPMQLTTQTAGV